MASVSVNNRMVLIPQKKSFEINMVYPLQQYIKQTYTSNLEDYLKSVDALNQLRSDALFKSTRQDKLAKLTRYYDQMSAIEGKLPISENQIRIQFKWNDAFDRGSLFGRSALTLSSGLYERLCVLFNIGAVAAEIAAIQQLDTEDGLKTAAKLYQQAAGAFSFIRDSALTTTRSDCTSDLYHETLSALIAIMLAHAQEVFYHKAVKDKMKELIIAKLAMQCSDLYSDAMKTLQHDNLKDLQKAWLSLVAGKQALFHGLAEYHKAEHEDAEKNIGESLSRLIKSVELLKIADQRGGKDLPAKNYIGQVQGFYEKAKKENDYVYHERVPDYKTLPSIDKAILAKITQVKFPITEDFRDLFATMVPMAVNNGLHIFKSRKMEVFNMEIGKLRQATELLNGALSALNLPAAIEDVSGSNKLPQSIIDKSQLIKDRGGIIKIDSMMAELPPLLQRNMEILNETRRSLDEEAASDSELRAQLREKWSRTASSQLNSYLFKEIDEFHNIINKAVRANGTVEEKYKKNRDGIQLLSRPIGEISGSLPSASTVGALQNSFPVKEIRRLLDLLEGLKNVRDVLESEMKTADSDALTARLISSLQTSTGVDQHSIIQQELDALTGPIRQQVRENVQEQEKLLTNIERANSDFLREKGSNQSSEIRDEMLRNLAAASNIYNELYDNLQEGNKFYNELTPILIKFQTKVNDFVFARKTEKDDLMKDIQSSLSRPGSGSNQAAALQKPARPAPPAPTNYPAGGAGAPPYTYAPPPTQTNENYQQQQAPYPVSPYYPMMPMYPYGYYPTQPGQPQPGGQAGIPPAYPYPQQNNQYPYPPAQK